MVGCRNITVGQLKPFCNLGELVSFCDTQNCNEWWIFLTEQNH